MAHIAKLGGLTDELVTLITSKSSEVDRFHSLEKTFRMSEQTGPSCILQLLSTNTEYSQILRSLMYIERVPSELYDFIIIIGRTNLML